MKHKSETFAKFQGFKYFAKKDFGKSIKNLKLDNGGEFIKKSFEAHLSKHGIQHQKTIPYTPQQNGVAKRKNRNLIEMARYMLYSIGLHKFFGLKPFFVLNLF